MERNNFLSLIAFIAVIVVIGGVILLQIYLSKRDNPRLGLILPGMALVSALTTPFMMVGPEGGVATGFVWQLAMTFLIASIPAIVLFGIYYAVRERKDIRAQLDKMSKMDL